MSYEPAWLVAARRDIGQRETLGPNDSPWIRNMLAGLSALWLKGQPWCGGAVAHWMRGQNLRIPKDWYRAKAWLDWGVPMHNPAVGCVVIFERTGGGHVGLVTGRDQRGRLMVLGGNQGDAINVSPFEMGRVLGYRWPAEDMTLSGGPLPVLSSAAASSLNEA